MSRGQQASTMGIDFAGKHHPLALIPYYFLMLYNTAGTFRSLVHIFYEDGGSHSIAGLPPISDDPASKNIVTMFAQWGANQLVLAGIIWWVLFSHPEHLFVMLVACWFELFMRWFVGGVLKKRLYTSHTPPGAKGTIIMLPIMTFMCIWSYFYSMK